MKKISLIIKATLVFFLFIAQLQASNISMPPNDDLTPFTDITISAPFEQDMDIQKINARQEAPKNVSLEIVEKTDKNSPIFAPTAVPNDIGIIALILFVVFICLIRKSNNLI